MKKRFLKRSCAVLTVFVFLASFALFSGNDLYPELTVFAAGNFNDIADFELDSKSSVSPAAVDLHNLVNITLDHNGEISVKQKPINKEAIVLFDSCYLSTETPSIIDFILSNCFYSLTDLMFQGEKTEIEGSIFVRKTFNVTGPTTIDGVARYYEKKGAYSNYIGGTEVKMTYEEAHRNDDKLVSDSEGNFKELFDFIQGEIEGQLSQYPEEERAKYIFKEITKEFHFPDGGKICRFDDKSPDIYVRREERRIGENENAYTVDGETIVNYYIEGGGTFYLRDNMYFDGNLKISVPEIRQALDPNAKSAFIFATGNIQLQGQGNTLDSYDNIILLSKYGDISFEAGSSLIKSIAFAPNGTITIHGGDVNLQGCFVANNIVAESRVADFKGPSESQKKEFGGGITRTEGFDTVRAAIEHISDLFDDQTKVGIIKYSDYADINDFDINAGGWKFYDIRTEQSQLKSYVSSLNADTKTEKSNLGDAIRRALGIFNSKLSDNKAEKFLIIFTGMDPNAYTFNKDGDFETDLNKDVNINFTDIEEGDSKGNDYVKRMVSEINNYNNANKGNIHTILVDLSKFREDSNVDNFGKPRVLVPQLIDLAANLGIPVTPNQERVITDDDAYYCPTKEQVDNFESKEFIIRQLASFTNEFKTRLAVEDLNIEAAKFELELPKALKPTKLKINFTDRVKELNNTDIPYISSSDSYKISYDFTREEINRYVKLLSIANGKDYYLTAGSISVELFANNDDNSFSGSTNELKIEKTFNISNASITYTFKDEDSNLYEYKVDFNEVTVKVTYNKDIN